MSQFGRETQLLNFFNDSKNFRPINLSSKDLTDEEMSEDEQNDSQDLMDNLNRFFITQRLNKCTAQNLAQILNKNLNSFLYRRIKSLSKSLKASIGGGTVEEQITQLVTVIEVVYDHLTAVTESADMVELTEFAEFFIITLKSCCVIFDYLKDFVPSSTESR